MLTKTLALFSLSTPGTFQWAQLQLGPGVRDSQVSKIFWLLRVSQHQDAVALGVMRVAFRAREFGTCILMLSFYWHVPPEFSNRVYIY